MVRKKFNIFSLATGVYLGLLLGWYLSGILLGENNALIILFSGFTFGFFAYKKPVLIETFAYGFTILVFFQAFWDWGARDWSNWRSSMTLAALGLFLLNLFSGHVKIKTAKKVLRGQLGIR